MITGARATGKTTSAALHAHTVVKLDQPRQADAFRADVDAALRVLPEPVLLDEWQVVPEVLGAIKRAVDAEHRPGRFLLTGSARDQLDAQMWPGTGRVIQLAMGGLTRRELDGDIRAEPFLDRVAQHGEGAITGPVLGPDLGEYLDLAFQGGFPEPLGYPSDNARDEWFASYIEQLVTRDARQLDGPRDPVRLRRFFETLAITSAGGVSDKKLYETAGVDRKTAEAYLRLLEGLFVVDSLPAWSSHRVKRLARAPKRFLVDPALLTAAVGIDRVGVQTDSDILGRVVETFVLAQLRAELSVCRTRPRLFHLRQDEGRHEVDLIVEIANQRVIAIEIKADATPSPKAARHLAWLRDQLDDKFILGIVLNTGPAPRKLDDKIVAAPIASIWS